MAYFGRSPPKGAGKWAFSDRATLPAQKSHFSGYNSSDHDIMQKRRLASRVFGFTRHPKAYHSSKLVQPPPDSLSYASEDERLNKDVEAYLKESQRRERVKSHENLKSRKTEHEYQHLKAMNEREDAWQKELDHIEFFREKPHARIVANRSGSNYDILTLEYLDSFAGQRLKYEDDCQKWRNAWRKLHLTNKASGCGGYNIVNWQKMEPLEEPVKPSPPEPPSPKPRRSLSVPSSPAKLRPSKDECPACPMAGVDVIDYGPAADPQPSSEPLPKVREIFVSEKHPWEHYA